MAFPTFAKMLAESQDNAPACATMLLWEHLPSAQQDHLCCCGNFLPGHNRTKSRGARPGTSPSGKALLMAVISHRFPGLGSLIHSLPLGQHRFTESASTFNKSLLWLLFPCVLLNSLFHLPRAWTLTEPSSNHSRGESTRIIHKFPSFHRKKDSSFVLRLGTQNSESKFVQHHRNKVQTQGQQVQGASCQVAAAASPHGLKTMGDLPASACPEPSLSWPVCFPFF